ncbi:ThuA domain-containing protein [Actinocrispum wychmicini]|uniref:Ricin-type beta-trefoil lectin protein n=1 Tax=Actinocrispum wychmicini TaxID=1213861 RepID=A0A4R2IIU3_9PSEU|nr:ThuA domain-containing protein [Actinocrispum wychmicini]TCO44232.1 ricin-type beta-trefoil lectin protein [Actinocrispum wychmicini]
MSSTAGKRPWLRALTVIALFLGFLSVPTASAAPQFKVLAFYNGGFDTGHIAFVQEANPWFAQLAAQNDFGYTATRNWDLLADPGTLAQYQVVMFLDDLPHSAAQQQGFQNYVRNGGGFFGFHVSAFTQDPNDWPWYHSTFLGAGTFRNNTWGPAAAILNVENRTHPATAHLPAVINSSVSEWYSWNNDLRQNPNITILASVNPRSFPLGTDPNQAWYSGYYPIMWTNKNFRMLYANFGHDAVGANGQGTSSTFASADQNRFILDGLLWLGGGTQNPDPLSPTAWYSVVNKGTSKCVDARAAATANGTVIQQYTCNSTTAQQFQFQPTSGGYTRVNNRNNPAQVVDVTGVSTADNAGLQLWAYGGGTNQQWQPVAESGGFYHFVSRNSGKCLAVPTGSAADSVQLVQLTCDGGTAQSFGVNVLG